MPSSLRQERNNTNEEEASASSRHVVHPSPAEVDDNVWRADAQSKDNDLKQYVSNCLRVQDLV